ncbi:hypothetical protein NLG97_g8666 [Lecanicillium saksenae]|uniref:Uncharacterized protein n=1 Tax=Lecanicillium saksenae TaxID=468837 RepID=A0ACC1QLK4_9HYPO|nr:hypothetical protein NLG97_g8666 [Lecanicillium saksenae]
MNAKDETASPNRTCENRPQVDSATEYCAKWLATVSATQPDETGHLSQAQPLSQPDPEHSSPDQSRASPVSDEFCLRVTHHPTVDHVLRSTPSPASSRIPPVPHSVEEHPFTVPYDASPRQQLCEASKYERRPRRKTRPDRYDTSRQHHDARVLSRRERREEKRQKLRSRKEVMNNFYSLATENRHVIMKPTLATGAFVNGRGSVATPLADLTFNELTFPVIRKTRAARPVASQRSNGARDCTFKKYQRLLSTIEKDCADPDDSETTPETPSPPPRPRHEQLARRTENSDHNRDAHSTNDIRPALIKPPPIAKYVDIGVDAMSDVRNLGHHEPETMHHPEFLPAEPHIATEELRRHPGSYYPKPNNFAQYFEPSYFFDGIHQYPGLQPNANLVEALGTYYPKQYIYEEPAQYPLDYHHWNMSSDSYASFQHVVPTSPSLDENRFYGVVPDSEEQLYKPDEETKAFWRPNFLR